MSKSDERKLDKPELILEQADCLFTCRLEFGTGCSLLPRFPAKNGNRGKLRFGVTPEEFPVYRECPDRRGQKEMP